MARLHSRAEPTVAGSAHDDKVKAEKNQKDASHVAKRKGLAQDYEANHAGCHEPGEADERRGNGQGGAGTEGQIKADSHHAEGNANSQGVEDSRRLSSERDTAHVLNDHPSEARGKSTASIDKKAQAIRETSGRTLDERVSGGQEEGRE